MTEFLCGRLCFLQNNEFPNDVYAMGSMIVGATMEVTIYPKRKSVFILIP